jgi:3-oxoacyl-[acyl-carrier-protein] synthase II
VTQSSATPSTSDRRRVVITGMGVLACNGNSTAEFWDALKAGRHGIGPITSIDVSKHKTRFGGSVPLDNAALVIGDMKQAKRKDRFVLLALKAAYEAITSSGLDWKAWADPFRVGCVVGSGIGGLRTIEEEYATMAARGPSRVSPFLVPKMIVDSAAGDISIAYGAKGPNYSITTAELLHRLRHRLALHRRRLPPHPPRPVRCDDRRR